MEISCKPILVIFILITVYSSQVLSDTDLSHPDECLPETGDCIDKSAALKLKIIAIVAILVTSVVGVCLPLVTTNIPALRPDGNIFLIVKSFAGGIILATGFMHVLPDSFNDLNSTCLPEKPWHVFPFTTFVAMLSALTTLMVDSLATSFYNQKAITTSTTSGTDNAAAADAFAVAHHDLEMVTPPSPPHYHSHAAHNHSNKLPESPHNGARPSGSQLVRYRVIAMVLELGIIVHSVIIGLSMGASNNKCTIRPLVAALCFHQMFEGMGLGGCILQAEYTVLKRTVMAIFFSITTPFGIVVGLMISNTYEENSPTSLVTEGLLNASSAGLLIYMALVDLLSPDFMSPKMQRSMSLLIKSFTATLLGAGGMSLLAKWA